MTPERAAAGATTPATNPYLSNRFKSIARRYADMCVACHKAGVMTPFAEPLVIGLDGVAGYRCTACGARWTCWWAVSAADRRALGRIGARR